MPKMRGGSCARARAARFAARLKNVVSREARGIALYPTTPARQACVISFLGFAGRGLARSRREAYVTVCPARHQSSYAAAPSVIRPAEDISHHI